MNILITNIQLTVPGGTVSYVSDLALGLQQKGFSVEIFTYRIGRMGKLLQAAGINVVTELKDLKNEPDLIHAHHHPTAMDALLQFTNTPVIFLLHDSTSPFDHPLKHRRILCHVAVDYNCLDRLLQQGSIAADYTKVIYNWVDIDKFKLRDTFSDKARNALVFSNYATKDNHYKVIAAACQQAGIPLATLGEGMGTAVANPEDFLGQYDLVFAKAKAAIEALATGAGVIVCDFVGLGQMVSPSNIEQLRQFNFGRRTLTRPYEVALIVEEINKFNGPNNRLNAQTIRQAASFDKTLNEIVALYQKTMEDYAAGKRGPTASFVPTRMLSLVLKSYFLFTTTLVFKKLSQLKYKIKNRLHPQLG